MTETRGDYSPLFLFQPAYYIYYRKKRRIQVVKILKKENQSEELTFRDVRNKLKPNFIPQKNKFSKEEGIKCVMQGIILGDVAGSKYEGMPLKNWEDPNTMDLFGRGHIFTDDTVLSIAVMDATRRMIRRHIRLQRHVINTYKKYLRKYAEQYPDCGFGGAFYRWMFDPEVPKGPYNSCGNGAAMRSGIIGAMFENVEKVMFYAYCSAMPTHPETLLGGMSVATHNHPEGIKGAIVIAVCVWMVLHGADKAQVKQYITEQYPSGNGFKINGETKLDDLIHAENPLSTLSVICQTTVPMAVINFLESDSFESCLRNSMRYLCDRDTIGAISGGIAGAFYGPEITVGGEKGERIVRNYLDEILLKVI